MQRLGPFDVIEPIGAGGMGSVWRALHRTQSVPAAIKFVLTGEKASEKLLTRFGAEVRAVAGLDHPGIVSVFDYGTVPASLAAETGGEIAAGTPWLAMELISGGTLKTAPPRDWPGLHDILTAVLQALGSAHARGILHRDLKPDNVLIASQTDLRPGLRLVDFGLAFLAGESNEDGQSAAGTPRYMAPEQLLTHWRDFGPWTDLYALGCLAWQLATGATPFQSFKQFRQLVRAHLHLAPPSFLPLFKVPDTLEPWLRTLLAKRRMDRFRFAADALAALPPKEHAAQFDVSLDIAVQNIDFEDPDRTILSVPTAMTINLETNDVLVSDKTNLSQDIVTAGNPKARLDLSGPSSLDETIPEMPASWHEGIAEWARFQMIGVGLGLFGLRTPTLVGRAEERDTLWRALHTVRRSGRPRLVLLTGGPGSGKSRLADWLVHRAHELGAAIPLRATHDPQGSGASGLPGMVHAHLQTKELGRDALEDRIAQLLNRQGVQDAYEVQALRAFLDPTEDTMTSDLSMSIQLQSPAERMVLMERFVARTAARRPVILWLDDVQWGDEALQFAGALQKLSAEKSCPVLVVMTLREDLIEDRPLEKALLAELDRDALTELAIGPLPHADQVALVENMLGLEEVLAEKVVERSSGNPLFAVQLVGDWVQRGVLEVGENGFVLRPGERAELPGSIHQMWEGRLDALLEDLPVEAEFAIELAATLGLQINGDEWHSACTIKGFSPPRLLTERVFKRRLGVSEDGMRWRFAHGMLRESLMRRASEAGRLNDHHLACAEALATGAGGRGVAERRAKHLIAGGAYADALEPLLKAASERMASSDFRQALSLLDDHTQAAVRAAVELSDPRRLRTQVLRSEVYAVLGRNDESVRIADQVLEPARALGDDVLIGSSLKVLGVATQRSGHTHGALELLRDALQHFRRADAKEHEALTLLALAGLTRHVGWWEEGEAHAREALSIGEQLDGPRLQAGAHFFLGALSVQQGSLVDAERHYRAAAGLHETAGYRLGVANCTNALGNLARSAGRFEEAERSFRQAIELHKSIGSGQDIGPMMSLALSHIDTGDFGAARAILEAGCARFRERNQNNLLGCALACLLPCLANAEEWSRWDRTLSEARTLLEETGILSEDVARPAEVGAEFALKAGHPGRAKEAYEIAMRQWMGLGRDERVGALMKAMEPLL